MKRADYELRMKELEDAVKDAEFALEVAKQLVVRAEVIYGKAIVSQMVLERAMKSALED